MSNTIYIEDYSDKSFVVRGETKEYKESLKIMGGKWNGRLTDKTNGDKFGAWLFWSDKRKDLDKWFLSGCPRLDTDGLNGKSVSNTYNTSSKQISNSTLCLEEKVDYLIKMVEYIYKIHDPKIKVTTNIRDTPKLLSQNINRTIVDDDIEEIISDDNEPKVPPKRLLGGRK